MEGGRGPRVPSAKGPEDQDISKSHSNTSLTLKKVHLVFSVFMGVGIRTKKVFFVCAEINP